MKMEKDRFVFWMILFTIVFILCISIVSFFEGYDFVAILLSYGFLVGLAFCLSIPETYLKVERYNKELNERIDMIGEKNIVIYCEVCQTKITNNQELTQHRLNCAGILKEVKYES